MNDISRQWWSVVIAKNPRGQHLASLPPKIPVSRWWAVAVIAKTPRLCKRLPRLTRLARELGALTEAETSER